MTSVDPLTLRLRAYLRPLCPQHQRHMPIWARLESEALSLHPLRVLQHEFVFALVRWGRAQVQARVRPKWSMDRPEIRPFLHTLLDFLSRDADTLEVAEELSASSSSPPAHLSSSLSEDTWGIVMDRVVEWNRRTIRLWLRSADSRWDRRRRRSPPPADALDTALEWLRTRSAGTGCSSPCLTVVRRSHSAEVTLPSASEAQRAFKEVQESVGKDTLLRCDLVFACDLLRVYRRLPASPRHLLVLLPTRPGQDRHQDHRDQHQASDQEEEVLAVEDRVFAANFFRRAETMQEVSGTPGLVLSYPSPRLAHQDFLRAANLQHQGRPVTVIYALVNHAQVIRCVLGLKRPDSTTRTVNNNEDEEEGEDGEIDVVSYTNHDDDNNNKCEMDMASIDEDEEIDVVSFTNNNDNEINVVSYTNNYNEIDVVDCDGDGDSVEILEEGEVVLAMEEEEGGFEPDCTSTPLVPSSSPYDPLEWQPLGQDDSIQDVDLPMWSEDEGEETDGDDTAWPLLVRASVPSRSAIPSPPHDLQDFRRFLFDRCLQERYADPRIRDAVARTLCLLWVEVGVTMDQLSACFALNLRQQQQQLCYSNMQQHFQGGQESWAYHVWTAACRATADALLTQLPWGINAPPPLLPRSISLESAVWLTVNYLAEATRFQDPNNNTNNKMF